MPQARFERRSRLTRPAEYRRVFADPERSSARGLLVLARSNDLGHPRLGLAIAKRHVKLAHDRNRIKRLVRESFRRNQHWMAPKDFIVLARGNVVGMSNEEITWVLERHWRRLASGDRG